MKKLLLFLLAITLFCSCNKSNSNLGTPNVSISNYWNDNYYLHIVFKNTGNKTAYNVRCRVYATNNIFYSDYNYNVVTSLPAGYTYEMWIDYTNFIPYTYYFTIYTPTWN